MNLPQPCGGARPNRRPRTDCVLGVDVGTSAVKAGAYDLCGRALPHTAHRESHRPGAPAPGASEFEPEVLVETVARCIDGCLARLAGRSIRPVAVGMCTFWHSMTGVDNDFRAVTPLYTWADQRPGTEAARLAADPGAADLPASVGCPWHPSYFPARLLWVAQQHPDLFARVSRWVSPGEYIHARLFGHAGCSVSMASATGLLDQASCAWSARAATAAGISVDHLGPLIDLSDVVTGLTPPWASRWPALADVPWAPAIGDGAAGTLGSGCHDEREMALNLGTSGALRVLYSGPVRVPDPGLWSYRLTRSRPIAGAAFSDGGNLLRWMRSTLRCPRDPRIRRADPGLHGLSLLPTFAGERSPGWRPDSTGAISGLTLETSPGDLLQAAAEALALRFAHMADALRSTFPLAHRIVASGGQLVSQPELPGLLADALGVEVLTLADTEASCRGAALSALIGIGAMESPAEIATPPGQTVAPCLRRTALYRTELARQQDLAARLAERM